MEVKVLFFGILKDVVQRESDILVLPSNATLEDLLRHYKELSVQFKQLLPSIAFSVNQEYASPATKLKQGDEVALLPPVSGGSSDRAPDEPSQLATNLRAATVKQKIDTGRVLDGIKQPFHGAVVVFEGIVRNNTRGRRTLHLDYESYEDMALKQMESLAAKALRDFKVRDIRVVHRLGRLLIGETSVLIVVAAEHRGAAFDACRWLIDTLKRTVPIWKKEYFEDGAVWADGEPFPIEISRGEGTH
ncbi:MAG: molybdenum cofactor biosynthesis protein MoaE [Terriglobales bacterium]|jgi:molybdopterin synthase catalytic subunit